MQLPAHYRVLRTLGRGGMGEIYLAEDTRLDRKVAIKVLTAERAGDPQYRRRLLTEAKAASALNHPNVCIIHEVGETKDREPYITMEFVEGVTLDERLGQGSLAVREVVDIAAQVADALDAAHAKGIVHRDIKPANIRLNERGQIKVLDFGLAKRIAPEQGAGTASLLQTQPGDVLGTPVYMSPEQALGKELDCRSDIFSLGVVLYELVTGSIPFDGSTFGEVVEKIVHAQLQAMSRFNYDLPPELERITRKCLEKEPARRYQSAGELLVDLRNLQRDLAAESVGATPVDPTQKTRLVPPRQELPESPGGDEEAKLPEPVSPSRLEDAKKSDVFISYSHVDDQPLSPGRRGWISEFHRHLEVRLEQLSGEKVRIWRPTKRSQADALDSSLEELLPEVKTMVSVLSPPFVHSEGCRREVQVFFEGAQRQGGLRVADRSRLVKVVKTPVAQRELCVLGTIFDEILGYEFYEEDPTTGRIREFEETFGEEARRRYYERVYDLAYEINEILRLQRAGPEQSAGANGNGRTVYLTMTTSDLQVEYDGIRRELLEHGHRVLPDRPLPLIEAELGETVQNYLQESDCIVQLVGRNYGLIPENARQSLLELQSDWAAERARVGNIPRLIWMPKPLEVEDERQARFIRRLREDDAAQATTELVEGTLTLFKDVMVKGLAPPEEKGGQEISGASRPPRVYLICDRGDEKAVEPLEDYLFEQGLEVSLPDFECDQEEVSQLHRANLQDCDAVLIYYGTSRKSWVEIKLRSALKANGYGRREPLEALAVYIAPPEERRKERFRSHLAQVLRQRGEAFAPTPELEAFLAKLKRND